MDPIVALKALILGIVEGLTEFLPVSSTGHLIVVGSLLNWNDEKGKLFEIVIQFAAILAVCWQYRQRLWAVVVTLPRDPKSQRFTLNLVLAFLPAAVLGVLLIGKIKEYLFAPIPVAAAFIIGGLLILWIESRKRTPHVATVDDIRPADATWIGFAQALSMIPGTSRSGATIMGGLLRGLSRPAGRGGPYESPGFRARASPSHQFRGAVRTFSRGSARLRHAGHRLQPRVDARAD